MNRFIIIPFIIAAFIIMLPQSSCKALKKSNKTKSQLSVDSSASASIKKVNATVDSAVKVATVEKKSGGKIITETNEHILKEAKSDPFTIVSKFNLDKIDYSAGGDTIRFLSIEDDRIKLEAFVDKKTGQGTAILNNKGQTLKIPFAKSTKTVHDYFSNTDSTGLAKKVTSTTNSIDSAVSTSYTKKETKLIKNREVKKTGGLVKWIGLVVLVAAVLRLAIYLLRKQWPWVGWLNKFLGGK